MHCIFIVTQQDIGCIISHQTVCYGVFDRSMCLENSLYPFLLLLQQAVALQWLREPCLLLGNKKNECGLFHNQTDVLKERFLAVCMKEAFGHGSDWYLSNEEKN